MANSGIEVDPACKVEFEKLKLGRPPDKPKYIIFNIAIKIYVEKVSTDDNYETFLRDLPEDECRFAVYDFEFEKEGGTRNKIIFIRWSPDNASIKRKMIFSSSADNLKKELQGIAADIQGTDLEEVSQESILQKFSYHK